MMVNCTLGWRWRNGVVRLAIIASAVGIAAMRRRPVSPWRSALISGAHRALVADDAPRPVEHALAFGRQSAEARAAVDQQHAHLFFELLDPGRERRLGHAAGLRGTAEMPLARQGKKEFKFIDQCVSLFMGAPPSHVLSRRTIDNFYRSDRDCGLVLYQLLQSCSNKKGSGMDARTPIDHGGSGRKKNRPRRTPKGRQIEPAALDEVRALLGDTAAPARPADRASASHPGPLRPPLRRASRGARARDEARADRSLRGRDLLRAFRCREGRRDPSPAGHGAGVRLALLRDGGRREAARRPAGKARPRRARRARAVHGRVRSRAGRARSAMCR